MDKVTKSKGANPKLALKKENLQRLKVRTDLKGGVAFAAVAACVVTHHCAQGFIMRDTVIIPRP